MDMKSNFKNKYIFTLCKYGFSFFLVMILAIAALLTVAKIPRNHIYKKMLESAEYLRDSGSKNYLLGRIKATCTDQFADTLLLNIAYNYDSDDSLDSIIWSKHAGEPSEEAGTYFYESVKNGMPADHEYLRYWHGSNIFIRPLHLIFNVSQIYIFHAIIIAALLLWLSRLLLTNNYSAECIAFIISMIAVSIWTVPFCLEYTWVFLIMLITSIISLEIVLHDKESMLGMVFMIAGMITAYLDFLTAETLTYMIPLLLVLRIRNHHRDSTCSEWVLSLKSGILWSVGYVGMWTSKWLISSLILHQNVMPYVKGHISNRQGGSLIGMPLEYLSNMFLRNIYRLFPIDYGFIGALVFLATLILIFISVYLNKIAIRKSVNRSMIGLYAVLFMIPLCRFLIMHSHSMGHNFFTYRALAASVLALSFILFELVEVRPGNKKSAISSSFF